MSNDSENEAESDSESGEAVDDSDDGDPAEWWDEVYESEGDPAWDIGEPQPAFAELAEAGDLTGRILDAGCGTGTHALWAAELGHPAVGVDVSEKGIEQARAKADQRGLTDERDRNVSFRVANALDLPDDLGPFDTVLDSGLFHAFDAYQRETYADELAGVVASGGQTLIVGFAEGAPEDWGPNPFARSDVRAAFSAEDWSVIEFRDVEFETRETSVSGLLAVVERL